MDFKLAFLFDWSSVHEIVMLVIIFLSLTLVPLQKWDTIWLLITAIEP